MKYHHISLLLPECVKQLHFHALNISELPQIEMLSEDIKPWKMCNDTLLLEHLIWTSV